jgi:hypothetical protein
MSFLFFRPPSFVPLPRELLALPFYRLKRRIRLTTNPRRCLGGEGGASTVDVDVATCPGACRPSLGHHGDVDDRTAGHTGCSEDVRFPVVDVWVMVSLFD